jgi:hypothetical protein
MKNKLGYFGFIGFAGVLGFLTHNPGFYGFFGFFGYFAFFKVIPDELFKLNVQKAATTAFFIGIVITVITLVCSAFTRNTSIVIAGFAIDFAVSIFVFSIIFIYLNYNESKGNK